MPRTGPALLAAAAALAAVFTPMTAHAAERPPPTWSDCGDGLQCAALEVPVDWREPTGPTTAIELARLPALGPVVDRGPLVVNAGGPSTTIRVLRAVPGLLDELRARRDVVLVDPRGLGDRTHVVCPTRPAVPRGELTRAEWERFTAENAAWDATCRAAGGPVADHLNSWQVAHDLDAVRTALGRSELDYFGNSYGTLYGTAYAELFPDRVGRMYLDSVVDHTGPGAYEAVVDEARVVEESLEWLAQWCTTTPACALHGADAVGEWDRLATAAEREPLPAPSAGTTVDAHQLRDATREMLQSPPFAQGDWPRLAEAIAGALRGDAAGFLPPPDQPGAPTPETSVYSQSFCADLALDMGFDAVAALEERLRGDAPRVGWTAFRRHYGECAGLALTDTYPLHAIAPRGLPRVLVAGGRLDHATPLSGAEALVAQLPGSRLISADDGHALYLHGNRCVRDHVHRFLDDGVLPPVGATCPGSAT